MLNKFLTNISNNLLFNKNDFLLVAVSGGVDSVVLSDLLHRGGYRFAIAHCNFSLRSEANKDEEFVQKLAQNYGVQCFSIQFDTLKYAQNKSLSIQMAARELRYHWFEELLQMYNFDYLLTAHHLDDNIETIFLNQIRETGIKGLIGILPKVNKRVRPLLPFSKDEILEYAKKNKLAYREDVSNYSDKYQRNFIRLRIIPLIKKIQKNFYSIWNNNIRNVNEAISITDAYVRTVLEKNILQQNDIIYFEKNKLAREKHLHFVLQDFLSSFHFNSEQIWDIYHHIYQSSNSGKKFYSDTHTLFFDRELVFIVPHNSKHFHQEYNAYNIHTLNLFSTNYQFEIIEKNIIHKDNRYSYIDADMLQFPLKIRHWKAGDKFRLQGTNYTKKLSDIFIDKKVPLYLKNKILLLCNGNGDIIWISNLNLIHNEYKIKPTTHRILKIWGRE